MPEHLPTYSATKNDQLSASGQNRVLPNLSRHFRSVGESFDPRGKEPMVAIMGGVVGTAELLFRTLNAGINDVGQAFSRKNRGPNIPKRYEGGLAISRGDVGELGSAVGNLNPAPAITRLIGFVPDLITGLGIDLAKEATGNTPGTYRRLSNMKGKPDTQFSMTA